MTANRCVIDGCARRHYGRGWCGMHYQRWAKHGDPLAGPAVHRSPEEAFAARTEWDGDCLVWTGMRAPGGYGALRVDGRMVLAHRYAWARTNGPIPDGMQVDHKCWNKACANAEHLRLASPSENSAYLSGPREGSKSGVRGVYQEGRKWVALTKKGGRTYRGGVYQTIQEAEAAVIALRAKVHGEYAGN